MKKLVLAACAASTLIVSPAVAKSDNGKGNGQGCSSAGATADSPGKWLQELRDHPWFADGNTPSEMAAKENLYGAGAGNTLTVGAFIAFFCGNDPSA